MQRPFLCSQAFINPDFWYRVEEREPSHGTGRRGCTSLLYDIYEDHCSRFISIFFSQEPLSIG